MRDVLYTDSCMDNHRDSERAENIKVITKSKLCAFCVSVVNLTLLAFTLTACTSQVPQTVTSIPSRVSQTAPPPAANSATETKILPAPTQARTASPTPSASLATLTPEDETNPNTQYLLTVEMDYARHHLAVEEQIAYTNRSDEPIPDLLLIVEPTRYPAVFHLKSLSWLDGQPVEDYQQDIGQLRIPLSRPLPPGEGLTLLISYELYLPSPDPTYYGRPVPFGYSPRQANLVDWYPFLPPYRAGQGWQANQAGAFGEYLVYESADFQVNIRLEDANQELSIAASAPAERDGDWYRYQHDSARNFAWSVSDQYLVSTTQVGSLTVLGYAFPVNAAAGETALQATADALALFNDLYGPYPHQTLSLVEADFLDGMEYDGLYFLSKGFYNLYSGTPADYLTAIAAHETAHQWWYGLVGNDQALEPWLDEALCTYSERIFYENLHPEALDWWWTYRINYFKPEGWVDGSIYNPAGYPAYHHAIYLNGAMFLEDLRQAIGDPAFFAFLSGYAERYVHRVATGDDFFTLLGNYSKADLTSLLDEYFQNR